MHALLAGDGATACCRRSPSFRTGLTFRRSGASDRGGGGQRGEGLIELFISHASADAPVAEALIALVRSTLDLEAESIRCTSVDGYRMAAGEDFESRLRSEVNEAKAFIGIVTPSSMRSAFVLFELGARWGAKRQLMPLLAAGAHSSDLGGPLTSLNALSCESAPQLHQLIQDLGRVLGLTPSWLIESVRAQDRLIETSRVAAHTATETSPQAIRDQLTRGIRNYFDGMSDIGPDPSQVLGRARGIAARLAHQDRVFEDVEAEIERRKRDDNNWTYANRLDAALDLVYALGLTPSSSERNRVFLDMDLPAIAPRPTRRG